MKLRPLNDRILVKRVEEETKTKGGIIIPDTAKEKPAEGKIVAVGKGALNNDGKRVPLEVKKGDRILFSLLLVVYLCQVSAGLPSDLLKRDLSHSPSSYLADLILSRER